MGKVEVGTEPGAQGEVVLWSADEKQLRSQFSKRYLKTQNMVIASERPAQSRTVYVNTSYAPPATVILRQHIDAALQGRLLCLYSTKDGQCLPDFVETQLAQLPAFHAGHH